MGIILLPAFLFYAAAAVYGANRSYKIIAVDGIGLYLGLLLASFFISALLPTINVYFRFKAATSLYVFDVPFSLLFNLTTAGLIAICFAVLNSQWLTNQPLPMPISVTATGILTGVAVGTLLSLFFVEQLLGLDKLPRTH
ncbi:hypothetical protein [Rheinheimera maricola]|uniref:Uncharacterized protein n=1 Tax=Rheinheimera maricola TaxID=2793282 RepID=A0ABS7X7U7_9GAMM|nr:hypothetical protein [Rheinheimera maricola]MBZ9611613.1 hypothetical protein [Rheinheimera maricola]